MGKIHGARGGFKLSGTRLRKLIKLARSVGQRYLSRSADELITSDSVEVENTSQGKMCWDRKDGRWEDGAV